jgi:hypothetical protein
MKLQIDPRADVDLPGVLYVKLVLSDGHHIEGWLHNSAIEELKGIVEARGGEIEIGAWIKDEPEDEPTIEQAEPGNAE